MQTIVAAGSWMRDTPWFKEFAKKANDKAPRATLMDELGIKVAGKNKSSNDLSFCDLCFNLLLREIQIVEGRKTLFRA